LLQAQRFAIQDSLLHDNAHLHIKAATTEAVSQLKFELFPHPHIVWAYVHRIIIFGPLKKPCVVEDLPGLM